MPAVQADASTTSCSVMRFWSNRAGGQGRMTRRDATAWDLSDMFDITRRRLPKPLGIPPAPDIEMTLAKCRADGKDPPVAPIGNARERSGPMARATLSG